MQCLAVPPLNELRYTNHSADRRLLYTLHSWAELTPEYGQKPTKFILRIIWVLSKGLARNSVSIIIYILCRLERQTFKTQSVHSARKWFSFLVRDVIRTHHASRAATWLAATIKYHADDAAIACKFLQHFYFILFYFCMWGQLADIRTDWDAIWGRLSWANRPKNHVLYGGTYRCHLTNTIER